MPRINSRNAVPISRSLRTPRRGRVSCRFGRIRGGRGCWGSGTGCPACAVWSSAFRRSGVFGVPGSRGAVHAAERRNTEPAEAGTPNTEQDRLRAELRTLSTLRQAHGSDTLSACPRLTIAGVSLPLSSRPTCSHSVRRTGIRGIRRPIAPTPATCDSISPQPASSTSPTSVIA